MNYKYREKRLVGEYKKIERLILIIEINVLLYNYKLFFLFGLILILILWVYLAKVCVNYIIVENMILVIFVKSINFKFEILKVFKIMLYRRKCFIYYICIK